MKKSKKQNGRNKDMRIKGVFPNVEHLLKEQGISRKQLASELQMYPTRIGNKLAGKSRISFKEAMQIKQVLGTDIPVDILFQKGLLTTEKEKSMAENLERGHAQGINPNFDMMQAASYCRAYAKSQLHDSSIEEEMVDEMVERQTTAALIGELISTSVKKLIQETNENGIQPDKLNAVCNLLKVAGGDSDGY